MSAPDASRFVDQLSEYQLLQPTQLEVVRQLSKAQFPEARALAAELLRREWLTAFQVNRLLQGQGKELVLGPYRLLERLGEGGMGQVFKARHVRMNRIVALKVIHQDQLTNAKSVQRFAREAQAAAQLSHPNIVLAHDADQAGNTLFLAMECIEGIDLARLVLQSGPLPIAQACEYIRQAALGLQHASEKGLVHRDIKPSNLMLTRGPEGTPLVKVMDFGLARFESEAARKTRLTTLGNIVGTVDYIAPEQAENARTADIRSDIYSLGCTLYYLLTGRPPFPGEDVVEKVSRRVLGEPPAVRAARPDVPAAVDRIVARMMARNPSDRFQTPGEVAAALQALVARRTLARQTSLRAGEAPSSPDPFAELIDRSAEEPKRKRTARSWMPGFAIAGAIAVLLASALIIVLARTGGDGDQHAGAIAKIDARTAKARRQQPARENAHDSDTGGIALKRDQRPPGKDGENGKKDPGSVAKKEDPIANKAKVETPSSGGQKKDGGAAGQKGLPADPKKQPGNEPKPEETPKPKPGGVEKNPPLQGMRQFLGHTKAVWAVAFSPDDRVLLTGGMDHTSRVWNVSTGEQTHLLKGHSWGAAFSPDGKLAATCGRDIGKPGQSGDVVRIWDTKTWEQIKRFEINKGEPLCIAFSHDSRKLITGTSVERLNVGGKVVVWDIETGKELRHFGPLQDSVQTVAFSPDGRLALSGGGNAFYKDFAIRLWDIESGREVRRFTGHTSAVGSVAFSKDGRRFLSAGWDKTIRLWEVATGKQVGLFTGHEAQVHSVAFAPNGRWFISGGNDRTVRLWDIASGKVIQTRGHAFYVTAVAISHDGSLVASSSGDTTASLWSLPKYGEAGIPASLNPPLPRVGFVNTLGMHMVQIRPGSFLMGSPAHEHARQAGGGDETQHRVTLTKPFYISATLVTQKQWKAIMGNNPSKFVGDDLPVDTVSWLDCKEFCSKLSAIERKQYRLPTEAEWEYACRAGTTTPFWTGETITPEQANYSANFPYLVTDKKGTYSKSTTPVMRFKPNPWGLYDMHGNLFQWCEDWYGDYGKNDVRDPKGPPNGTRRVLRGGAWNWIASKLRSAYRFHVSPQDRFVSVSAGCRVVHEFPFTATLDRKPERKPGGKGGALGTKGMQKIYLSNLPEFDVRNGPWRFGKGELGNPEASPVIINGVKSTHCLGMHPPDKSYTRVKYRIGKNAQLFRASVTLASGATSSSPVTFVILGDGKILWSSKPVQASGGIQECNLNVSKNEVLELRVYCDGSRIGAHAVWIEPYILTSSPSALRTMERKARRPAKQQKYN